MDVLADWGLANSQVEQVAGGATNETWRVRDGNAVAFLRKYRTTDLVAVQREHHIIEVVADRGVLTPRPLKSSSGNTIIESGDGLFALFEAAKGQELEPRSLTPSHASHAGQFLADLHHATAPLPTNGLRSWNLNWETADWANRVRATAHHIPHDSGRSVDLWAYQGTAAC